MTPFLETLELALLAVALFTAATAGALSLAYPWLRRRFAGLAPAVRSGALLALAAAPLAAGVLITAACFLPGELGPGGFVDHCDAHPGHVHLCLVHHPPLDQGLAGWAATVLAGLALAGTAAWQGRRLLRSARAVAGLRRLARIRPGLPGVHVIDAEAPLSAAAGLVRPAVYLSSGLVRRLDPDTLDVVRAHEHAHVLRRDPLRQVAAALLSLAHLPATRRRLLADLALATEQACDEAASAALGDRVRVARAVLAVERLVASSPVPPDLVAASFGGSHVPDRVESLLADPADGRIRRLPGWILAALLGLVLAASTIHHATETLLNRLTR